MNIHNEQAPIAILGAGSWGTALALYLARRGQKVKLWSIEREEISAMLADKRNERYLAGFDFPSTIQPVYDLSDAIAEIQDILIVVPSIGFKNLLQKLKILAQKPMRIICATKGMDDQTGQFPHEMVGEVLGNDQPFAVLSGPSFAREVAQGLPAALVLAGTHKDFLIQMIKRFNSPYFRIFPSEDVVGVEIGGVVKNVIAIATGISDGIGYGANMRSALITEGLYEITTFGQTCGAQLSTFSGLSGLGDLVLTATDDQSRNRRLGLALGKGESIENALKQIGQVVEGKRNAELVVQVAEKMGVKMPICSMVLKVLQNKQSAKNAFLEWLGMEKSL